MDENNQINVDVNQVNEAQPVAVPSTEPPKKNTPVIIIVLIVALCALVGLGVWYFGEKKAEEKGNGNDTPTEKPTDPTTPTDPTNPTDPTTPTDPTNPSNPTNPTTPQADQTLTCVMKDVSDGTSYSMTFDFYYNNKKLTSGDSVYLFDFSKYASEDPTTYAALKQVKMCDTVVAADPEVSEIFTDCKESWSDDGFLTLTTKVSLNALSEEYDKVDIDSLKAAFTQQGMDCTIK